MFMVKKEIFEWIRTEQKNIKLRRSRAIEGDKAVFQYGRSAPHAVRKKGGCAGDIKWRQGQLLLPF